MAEKPTRLSPDAWLSAGFRALVADGPDALKAEPLARALGTTKGSFYWHFKDVPDFQAKLLRHWQSAALVALAREADRGASPTDRLYRLAEITAPEDADHGGPDVEAAIRAWARSDPAVAAALAEIDTARLAYLGAVLDALDLTNPDFARLLYGAHIGIEQLSTTDAVDNRGVLSTLIAALLALQEA